jgi:Xaa-Pro aminopeptidase
MQKTGIGQVMSYTEFPAPKGEGWQEVLVNCLEKIKNLGVEPGLSAENLAKLAQFSPRVIPVIDQFRQIKSAAEIELIRQTAAYADMGMEKIMKASYRGATVLEIFSQARAVQTRVLKETAYDPMESSFLMASWPAPFSAQPHGIPRVDDRMGSGPLVGLSYLRVNGYAAEVERTYFHTPPSPEEKKVYQHMLEARELAVSMVRPGVVCGHIDEAVYQFLCAQGYESYLLHRTGHGIGLGNHEGPYIARGSDDVLKENMVISIEPGIYIPEIGGFRHSDTLLVTAAGCEFLTHHPSDMDALTLTAVKPLRWLMGKIISHSLGLK